VPLLPLALPPFAAPSPLSSSSPPPHAIQTKDVNARIPQIRNAGILERYHGASALFTRFGRCPPRDDSRGSRVHLLSAHSFARCSTRTECSVSSVRSRFPRRGGSSACRVRLPRTSLRDRSGSIAPSGSRPEHALGQRWLSCGARKMGSRAARGPRP
jgi:hypothetical protein